MRRRWILRFVQWSSACVLRRTFARWLRGCLALTAIGAAIWSLLVRLPRHQAVVIRAGSGCIAVPSVAALPARVLQTWNVFGLPWPVGQEVSRRCSAAATVIGAAAADVVALQEVWDEESRDPLLATGYHAVWCRSPQGLLGQNGLLTLSRHPVLAAESRCFDAASGIESLIGKGALCTRLALPDGDALTVWNVHLQSGVDGIDVRRSQITQLTAWIRGAEGDLRVVLGDFNCGPGDDEWSLLCTELAAIGLVPRSGHEPTWDPSCNPLAAAEPPASIDHVFVEHRLAAATPPARRLCSRDIDGGEISDHFAVSVQLPVPARAVAAEVR
jgi:endonuclease/exonuclease/phosphatase family metal-dependent hydrolase